jgi:hypothetical protein
MNEKERAFIANYAKAIVTHLNSRCVGIITFENEKPAYGSGVCVVIGENYFVATAAHVIQGCTKEDITTIHTRTPSNKKTPIISIGSNGGEDDIVDVGYLEIDPKYAKSMGKEFVDLSRLDPDHSELPNDLVAVYGCPEELINKDLLQRKGIRIQPIGYVTITKAQSEVTKLSSYFSTPSQKHDIYLEYPEEGNTLDTGMPSEKMPETLGMSGGGIWSTNVNSVGSWVADNCKLIAIQRSWNSGARFLRGTQIQHWLQLIKANFPILASQIP